MFGSSSQRDQYKTITITIMCQFSVAYLLLLLEFRILSLIWHVQMTLFDLEFLLCSFSDCLYLRDTYTIWIYSFV